MDEAIMTAMTTAFNQVKTDYFSVLEKSLPVALIILGTGLGITLGIRFFKKIASK